MNLVQMAAPDFAAADPEMLTVLGRVDSLNVRKVLWALDELNLVHVRHDYGGAFGRTNDENYKAINPTSLIPTLLHRGNAIWESNTILRYLGETSGSLTFVGTTAAERAVISQWMDWQLTLAATSMQPLFHQLVRREETDRDHNLIARKVEEACQSMALLDAALGDGPHITGEHFTAADCALGVYVHRYYALDIARPELARLDAYHLRLTARQAYARRIAIGLP